MENKAKIHYINLFQGQKWNISNCQLNRPSYNTPYSNLSAITGSHRRSRKILTSQCKHADDTIEKWLLSDVIQVKCRRFRGQVSQILAQAIGLLVLQMHMKTFSVDFLKITWKPLALKSTQLWFVFNLLPTKYFDNIYIVVF